ncbi:hypothetical protein Osc7112_2567 [Oscillatoria nigro-viridis PCC 7112]|uniref:Uncharacterized protein n=1 Tax=Phormidium nigroviride PCC 7112 TaxID=179408 RepID=K9VFW2_9CYAN|nr:hypothetical protein [Oscillatoria nigro-viridis]AFZ06988.1 hypothetical protein Osc7112_2567 [Oscillatoria nigro-viridis PCC 7112]
MKKLMPLLLGVVLLTNTVACQKSSEPIGNTSAPTNQSPNPVSKQSRPTSSQLKNQPAAVPAGTTFDTILQQDLSTGKNRDKEGFTLRVKGGNKTLKDAVIQGHLEDVVKAAKGKKASLHLVFDDIQLADGSAYPIDVTEREYSGRNKNQRQVCSECWHYFSWSSGRSFPGQSSEIQAWCFSWGCSNSGLCLV